LTSIMTYSSPTVKYATADVIPTSGSTSLTILGSLFGSFESSKTSSRIQSSSAEVSQWISSSCLTSKLGSTYGTGLSLLVTAALLSSKTTFVASFSPVSVSSIDLFWKSTSGSVFVTLFGFKFGLIDVSAISSRLGHSSSSQSFWISDSSLASKLSASSSILMTVFVSFGVTTSSLSPNISCSAVQLSSVAVQSFPATTGSFSISIFGASYRTSNASPRVIVGPSSCEVTLWVSDSSAICKAHQSVSAALSLTVSLSKLCNAKLLNALSYSRSFILIVKPNVFPSSGATAISVVGYSLGVSSLSSMSRILGTAVEFNRWVSDSSLVCKSIRSVASDYTLHTSSGNQVSAALTQCLTHDTPSLSSVSLSNVPITGSVSITAFGTNFGMYWNSLSRLKIGVTAKKYHSWVADSSIMGKTVAYVSLKTSAIIVVSVRSRWSWCSSLLSYDGPNLASVVILNTSFGFAVSGAALVTVVAGSSFSSQNPSLKVSTGSTSCRTSLWTSESSVKCKMSHGGFVNILFRVSSDLQTSLDSLGFAMFPFLTISSLMQRGSPTSGSVHVTVIGSNAGFLSRSQTIRIGFSAASSHSWTSDSAIGSKSSHGLLVSRTVSSSSALKTAALTQSFSYISPASLLFIATNQPSTGSSSVFMAAVGLGIVGMSGASRVGRCVCEASIWLSGTSILCRVPRGTAVSSNAFVSIANVAELSIALSFDAVNHRDIFGAANFPTSGALSVVFIGTDFGLDQSCIRASFRLSTQEACSWISTSTIVPKFPRGSNHGLSTLVSAQLRTSSLTYSFTFDVGVLAVIKSTNIPTTGASLASVLGSAFNSGSCLSHRARISSTAASMTQWHSDSSVLLRAVRGRVLLVTVFVSAHVRVSSITLFFIIQRATCFKYENGKPRSIYWVYRFLCLWAILRLEFLPAFKVSGIFI